MEYLKVIILGIVEGLTEFLPISSTGHLIVAAAILNFQNDLNGTFEIFIQLGAVIAVIIYYQRDLLTQARRLPRDRSVQVFWLGIVIAVIPAGILGFLLRNWIKEVLFSPAVVAISLILGGIIFLLTELRPPTAEEVTTEDVAQVSIKQAFIIGLAQTIALIPGVSRSGASIVGGMQAGLSRKAATHFSFYLAIPTLGGATLFELITSLDTISADSLFMLVLGAIVSGIIAWLSIGWLLRYVSNNTFVVFGYYRILAGIVILILVAAQIL
ncbi:MAG: undecaprenyl-diphosphate phosphatase [Anaerolineae bacterium]|nr:undecaprenyl-diphosphate phosphatase [Anaerolineae bacterium]